ncbi:MAG: ABC transporter permease [Defluviitaleaceae bacterium]|nr:ABC transporter permease [Defluviitaleaceae bacterium]MCL2262198.1 ABC transporter permease [Defluviitaleaceae bacterium]
MNIFESITSAAHSVFANRMRSVLTMLGIIIGISAVIMITSIGQGVQNSMNEMFAEFGAGTLMVNVRQNAANPATRRDMLTLESAAFLAEHPDVSVVSVASGSSARVQLRNPSETSHVQIIGADENLRQAQNVDVRFGRFLASVDVDRAAPVVVIESTLAREIFGRTDVVGETIRATFWMGTVDLTVVGVSRNNDPMAGMFGMPTTAYIPITYFQRILNRDDVVDQLLVIAEDLDRLDETATEVTRLLSVFHGNEDRYQVTTIMSQIDMLSGILSTITGFVALVAFISLAVGGIGVMNIMLVTVTERTREIGIRKSLGATEGNIRFQFLVEAMILTASGGIIGIFLGYYGGFALGSLMGLSPAVSIPTVVGTVLASSLIGIAFGVYPAHKAAKLDPIVALRYE